jgi:tRNA modification GTPase
MDIIRARTDRAHKNAVHELEGRLSLKLNEARDQLIAILAHIEAHIDFPEEDISPKNRESLLHDTRSVLGFLQSLLATYREGKILREGIPVAIVGRPNVGKSSLLNALLGEDRAIVSPIPGTTRDTLEEFANIQGIPFRFTDTAGLRHPRGRVEAIGVERASRAIADSDIVLHVLDASRNFRATDLEISKRCSGKPLVLVLNKSDLPVRFCVPPQLSEYKAIPISALTGANLSVLCDTLVQTACLSPGGETTNLSVAINERHHEALLRALNSLTSGAIDIERDEQLELVSQQLHIALAALGEITGKTATDDILDRVFSTFCIGK